MFWWIWKGSDMTVPVGEPGGSEYSWGKGMMVPPTLAPPELWQELTAVYGTDPSDEGASVEGVYATWTRESGTLPSAREGG